MIYHQKNIAAFKGAHVYYWGVVNQRISADGGAGPSDELIAQAKSMSRFTFARVFGRVN